MARTKVTQLTSANKLEPVDLLSAVSQSATTPLSTKITVKTLSDSLTTVSSSISAATASSADNFTVRNNLYGTDSYFTGTINANVLKVSVVSSSVVYSSGSNIFGDDAADTQQFTGSVLIRDSVVIPRFSSDPGGAQEGQLYYNTGDTNIYRYTSMGWKPAAGTAGTAGSSGSSGSSGSAGSSGSSGSSGSAGSSGTSGSAGSSGTSGANGATGDAGTNGSSGTSGSSVAGTGTVGQIAYFDSTTTTTSPNNSGDNRLAWDNGNSRLGIRTSSPSYPLDVNGDTKIGTSLSVGNINPSGTTGRIDASNDIVAYSTSDERLKADISLITDAIEKVNSLRGVNFTWIENLEVHGNSGKDVGLIAQEVEKVLPEVVQTRDNGYKAVKYDKIVSLLVEAIKDLQKQINELKSK